MFALRRMNTSPHLEFSTLLPQIETIARAAGEEIMKFHRQDHPVGKKEDGSPVTPADLAAEKIILAMLAQVTPDIPIISEEAHTRGEVPAIDGNCFWLVDPLDGTKEFIRGGQDFCVNIGLIDNGRPALGVLYGPALNILYSAAGDNTATVTDAYGTRSISAKSVDSGYRIVSSKLFGNGILLAKFLAGRTLREHRHRSSALKFGEIAEGRADLYPRFGPSCEWDTAAGHAIVEAAGGTVTTSGGTPLLYNKEKFVNPDFVARGLR